MIEYVVWVWLGTAYKGNAIKVGEFATCDQGIQVAEEQYPDHIALHCITPDLTPPGGAKDD